MAEETLTVKIKLSDFASRGMKKFVGVVSRSVAKVKAKLAAVKSAVFSLKGALIALGGAAVARSFITAGAELEKFRTQLVAVMDQNEELADSTLKWVREFAKVTPHMTNDVIQAFVSLQAAGVSANEQMMDTIGNVAYVFDRNIADVSLGLVSMEKEIFKRLGIQWEIVGQKAKIWSGDTIVHTNKAAKSMREGILEIWEKKFPGAMKRAEGDFKGLTALLASEWWEFRAQVMKAGVMDFIKAGLKTVANKMGGLENAAPKVAQAIVMGLTMAAKYAGYFATAVEVIQGAFYMLKSVGAKALQKLTEGFASFFDNIAQQMNAIDEDNAFWNFLIGKENMKGMKEWSNNAVKDLDKFSAKMEKTSDDALTSLEKLTDPTRLKPHERMGQLLGEVTAELELQAAAREKVALAAEKQAEATKKVDSTAGGLGITTEGIQPLRELNKVLKEAHDIEMAVLAEQAKLIKEAEQADLDSKLSAAQKRFESIRGTVMRIGSVLEDNILRAIDAAVEGTFRWRRALQDTLKDLGMTMAKMGISAGLQLAATGVAGALAAKGGVFPAFETRLPIKAYAKGGITQGPEIAIIGEGKKQEAVVPLDNGQKIPVEMKGEGGGTTNIYISAMDGADVMRVLSNNPEAVAAGVARARRDNPGFLGG